MFNPRSGKLETINKDNDGDDDDDPKNSAITAPSY